MRTYFFLTFFILLFISCQSHEKSDAHQKAVPKSPAYKQNNISSQYLYFSLSGMDSIVETDNFFVNSTIDSIAIEKLGFIAVYLYCFKGGIHEQNYHYLKKNNPVEYNALTAIHTAHLIIVNGQEYSFNGKGSIGCWRTIPESTRVSIDSKVYSLFSKRKQLGKLVVLESIKKAKKILNSAGGKN